MSEPALASRPASPWPLVITSLALSAAAIHLHFVLAGIDWNALERQLACLSPVARRQVAGALTSMRTFRFLGLAAVAVALWGMRTPPRRAPAVALAVAVLVSAFTLTR